MNLISYPRYKSVNAEFLDKVPEHWDMTPLKAVCSCNDEVLPENTSPNQVIEYVEISDVQSGRGIVNRTSMLFSEAPSRARRKVRNGDVLVSTVRTYLRAITSVTQASSDLIASTGFAVLRPRRIQPGFLGYVCQAEFFISAVISRSEGVSYPSINASDLIRLDVPIPTVSEQAAIVSFLDQETAKIDALVDEQRRLIDLLKEKRQAVISQAVTKGLDPSAPMKPSGIEWLGDVPAHWEIVPLKRDLAFLTSGSRGLAERYSDDGSIFVRIGNLTRDSIVLDLTDVQRVNVPEGTEGERTKVRPGDVLFSITAFLGSVAVVPSDMPEAFVSQHVALARLVGKCVRPNWVALATLSEVGKAYLSAQGYGGTKVQLSLEDVAGLILPVPPMNEQDLIVRYVEEELQKIRSLYEAATSAILLLNERRASLISAAVTGRIDVSKGTHLTTGNQRTKRDGVFA